MIYLWLPDAEFAKNRVQLRVTQGGHNIPEDVVERRYHRGLYNLVHLYLPLVDQAHIFDSTSLDKKGRRLVAEKRGSVWEIHRSDIWNKIEHRAEKE